MDEYLLEAVEHSWSLEVSCPLCGETVIIDRLPSLRDDPPMEIALACPFCGCPMTVLGRITFVADDAS